MSTENEDLKKKFLEKVGEIKKHPSILVKGAINLVVTASVGAVTTRIIHDLVPDNELSRKKKAELYIATWAVAGVVGDKAGNWAANDSMVSTLATTITDSILSSDDPKEVQKEFSEEKTELSPNE